MSTKNAKPEAARKKLTAAQIDLAKQAPGFTLKGKYIGQVAGAPFKHIDQKTGEVTDKVLTFAMFEELNSSDRFKVIADAGLKSCLADAMVSEGMPIEIVKLAKKDIKGGRSLNQYDIFAL